MIKKWVKKPVEIEAVQWTGDNMEEVMVFCNGKASMELMYESSVQMVLNLNDWTVIVPHGNFVVKIKDGSFSTWSEKDFLNTYEELDGVIKDFKFDHSSTIRFTRKNIDEVKTFVGHLYRDIAIEKSPNGKAYLYLTNYNKYEEGSFIYKNKDGIIETILS